ncbi:MAG: M28 family peptidase [Chloroflexota bacterium]
MQSLYAPATPNVEQQMRDDLSIDTPWALIERFTTLVRESGSEDERISAKYIADQLTNFGVSHTVYRPDLFISVPVSTSVRYGGKTLRAKSPSFSISTGPEGITAEAVYVEAKRPPGVARLFHFEVDENIDIEGKIVVCTGFGFPAAVKLFQEKGAAAQIYINPGVDIHWGVCTTIWGAPDLDNAHTQPQAAVASINRPDGEALLEAIKQGPTEVTVQTELKEGWFECPVIVAEIEGTEEPERFMLVHGHLDSWDVGIGDNAVGDATLLELARVFHKNRSGLKRSIRIAWWTAHSTGRYGGSTWFVDQFGLDLARNCIAQVNIDSPGCRWATEYYDISWMIETEDFCKQAILDTTGKESEGERPHQAGDYSFNNIGISSFFMLLSTMPREKQAEMGYYAVGGCGGNIAWHTENDQLEIADKDNLMRDLEVYVTSLQRVTNNAIHPFDFRRLAAEFRDTLSQYSDGAGGTIDFADAYEALEQLDHALAALYTKVASLAESGASIDDARQVNDAILELGRILIPINFTRHGMFRTEPATPIAPLPDIEPALALSNVSGHEKQVILTHVRRGLNRVSWAFESAARVAERAAG